MNRLLTEKELLNLGFQNIGPGDLDDGGRHEWWMYNIGSLQIGVTDEFDKNDDVTGNYVEIGDETFPHMNKEELIQLIQILRNGKAGD